MKHPLMKLWIVIAIVSAIFEGGLGLLMRSSMANNVIVPWRQPTTANAPVFMLLALCFGAGFSYIFLQGYRGTGIREGVRFGFWVTLVASVPYVLALSVMLPIGRRIPAEMFAIDLATFVACGIVAAAMVGETVTAKGAAA
ncbi:MAG TPA: hypothetical protein VN709_13175 [Terriglobales bacterium]|nr:hypothetical protein [Terriglobales bacterium]